MFFRIILINVLVLFNIGVICAQDDRSIFYRKEHIIQPQISTNGYGISFTSAKKRTIDNYFYWKISLSELKHRKEIKGVNPNYPNQRQFIFGKVNHAYPIGLSMGFHKKYILKNNARAIGIRYFYGAGIEAALLKPAYYQIELVYSQDSSRVLTAQFNPEKHNVNNIKERSSWFEGTAETNLAPGGKVEVGAIVDFSGKEGRIHGVGISSILQVFLLPVEILAGEPERRLYFGFSLSYVWGKFLDYSDTGKSGRNHSGWGMLKKY
ncbi:hypothetical protein L21SP5_02515 [Salinivirga cyanobacteriivorans]|uniref:Uncharacterized protein n=1 Tax=Salinivirga cyanobacteriivorans TaxID=1307839 RepID=A0A0S2I1J9_9BACT|nr:hypothetical protein [Salinivirga cyanobacteriivorans]ALO16139.1 hypothetical protein L21SP5_02515 [Salinivirga cyanobacteriivorans]